MRRFLILAIVCALALITNPAQARYVTGWSIHTLGCYVQASQRTGSPSFV
jgi:hypothetical protein